MNVSPLNLSSLEPIFAFTNLLHKSNKKFVIQELVDYFPIGNYIKCMVGQNRRAVPNKFNLFFMLVEATDFKL